METAKAIIKIGTLGAGHSVPRVISSAEAVLIREGMCAQMGEDPILSLELLSQKVTAASEKGRLISRYGVEFFQKIFPGARPNFPATFEEAGYNLEEKAPRKVTVATAPKERQSTNIDPEPVPVNPEDTDGGDGNTEED